MAQRSGIEWTDEIRQGRGGALTAADLLTLAELYYVSAQALTRRLEELDLIGAGTWDRLTQRGLRVREARALLELPEREASVEVLPPRYRLLAVEAFRTGALSEGQLARFLRVNRVEARRVADALAEGGGDGGADDPGGPLLRHQPPGLGTRVGDPGHRRREGPAHPDRGAVPPRGRRDSLDDRAWSRTGVSSSEVREAILRIQEVGRFSLRNGIP